MTKILIVTDAHLVKSPTNEEEADRLGRLHRMVDREIGNVDLIVNNGDLNDGIDSRADGIQHFKDGNAIFDQAEVPVMNIMGNHDFNSGYAGKYLVNGKYQKKHWVFPSDLYESVKDSMAKYPFNITAHGKQKMYSSIDVGNIRVIGLSEYDVSGVTDTDTDVNDVAFNKPAIGRQQFQWLIGQLESLPADMQVLIVYHVPMFKSSHVPKNKANYLSLIKAFQESTEWGGTKEVDDTYFDLTGLTGKFSGKAKGRLLGCISGHEHTDGMTYIDGIPHFMRLCMRDDWQFSKIPRKRKWGTDLAYDIVEVVNGRLRINRIGAGDSIKL